MKDKCKLNSLGFGVSVLLVFLLKLQQESIMQWKESSRKNRSQFILMKQWIDIKQENKKLKRGGNFYLSLPIGKERVEFNAHRIFYAETVIENFPSLELKEFSCTAGGEMEYNPDIHQYDNDKHMGDYRYGLFYFKKK